MTPFDLEAWIDDTRDGNGISEALLRAAIRSATFSVSREELVELGKALLVIAERQPKGEL